MKLSVIIPVHNEVQTVASVVKSVLAVPLDQEVILVNDASSDGSNEIIDKLASSYVTVMHHSRCQGKGAAVRSALDVATGDVIVIQDADFEYNPRDFLKLIRPISDGVANVVYGVRSFAGQKFIMRWGNRFVTRSTNILYNTHLKDMETCYKMIRRELALSLDLECRGFDIEAEITAKILRSGHTIYELPISYNARYENKKLSPLDGLPTMRALWKYRWWKPSILKSRFRV